MSESPTDAAPDGPGGPRPPHDAAVPAPVPAAVPAPGPAPGTAPAPGVALGIVVAVAAATAMVVGLVAGLGGFLIGRLAERSRPATDPAASLPLVAGDTSPRGSGTVAAIAESVLPAVVSIEVSSGSDGGTGSGFVIRTDGYVVTNNHVIASVVDGGRLDVYFADGTRTDGTIVGRNVSSDIAVVKVDRTGLPTVVLGDSDAVRVGDTAIAIGAPLGLEGTVTSGIISAVDRPVTTGGDSDESFIDAIQTDAALQRGNSGGPLLDGAGRVIGVISAIATLAEAGEGGNIGLGFAIPIDSAARVAEDIIRTGSSATPIIGVELDRSFPGPGAKVSSVASGGPSATAGLEAGDVITAVDDRAVADADELVVAIRSNAVGDTITLTVRRGDRDVDREVVLAASDASP